MPGGTEGALWKLMRRRGLPGHWQRVENRVDRGTPDVNFCVPGIGEGWLELKVAPRAPISPTRDLKVPHFTEQQRMWLQDREDAGGFAGVLLRIDKPAYRYILLPAGTAAEVLGRAPVAELERLALAVWGPKWDREALLGALRNGCL